MFLSVKANTIVNSSAVLTKFSRMAQEAALGLHFSQVLCLAKFLADFLSLMQDSHQLQAAVVSLHVLSPPGYRLAVWSLSSLETAIVVSKEPFEDLRKKSTRHYGQLTRVDKVSSFAFLWWKRSCTLNLP